MKRSLIFTLFFLSACTSIAKRNLQVVQDRAEKLKPLSSYEATWCRADVQLTEPASARYAQMFPEESLNVGSLSYTWKASESRCEITPLQKSKISDNHKSFMDQAMCVLLHTHWINSPFDEMTLSEDTVEGSDKFVRLKAGGSPDLGVFVDRKVFSIETKTKNRGTLNALYEPGQGVWLPSRIEHYQAANIFVVENLIFDSPSLHTRPTLKSFSIAIGSEKPLAHSHVTISDCRKN